MSANDVSGRVEPVGLIVVDKPGGMTSHDVVSRVRRLAHTRRVGHGGTLDPMATGLLVIGVGRATRLLTYVIGADKRYAATIRLGEATVTDDAEGEVVSRASTVDVRDAQIRAGLAAQTGTIAQVPSAVSAIKINGQRAYARVRAGESVALAARTVTVSAIDIGDIRRLTGDRDLGGNVIDVDVDIACSTGTYVRAIARDLGASLGVGGHLTALRRTAVGGFTLAEAKTLDELTVRVEDGGSPIGLSLDDAAARFFTRRDATAEESVTMSYGAPLGAIGIDGPYAVFAPDGTLLAVVAERDGKARAEVVFAPA